jgi:hypothetical protein
MNRLRQSSAILLFQYVYYGGNPLSLWYSLLLVWGISMKTWKHQQDPTHPTKAASR